MRTIVILLVLMIHSRSDGAAQEVVPAAQCLEELAQLVSEPNTDRESLIVATGCCIAQGGAAQAEALLRRGQDFATDIPHRLTLLDLWSWAARSSSRLKEMEDILAARQEYQPRSPVAALEFAIAGSGDLLTKRQAAEKAIRLASDGELLREIVSAQERAGEWSLALAAVERWYTQFPSGEAKCRLAVHQLFMGDPAEGWRLAEAALHDSTTTADDVVRVAEICCHLRDWRSASAFLSQAAIRFPQHLAVRGFNAIVAEECGDDAEAVAEFLAILTLRDWVMPKPQKRRGWISFTSSESEDVPEGTKDLWNLETWQTKAYQHRHPVSPFERGRRMGPDGGIQLPETTSEARAFALIHLRELAKSGAVSHATISERLVQEGESHLAACVEGLPDPALHPDHLPLHAWALTHWSFSQRPDQADLARRCLNLFSGIHPGLASKAAMELAKTDETLRQLAYEQFTLAVKKAGLDFPLGSSNAMRTTNSWTDASRWQQVMIDLAKDQLAAMPQDAGAFRLHGHYKRTRHEAVHALLSQLAAAARWDEYAQVIEEEALHHAIPLYAVSRPHQSLTEQALGFPNILTRWPSCVTDLLGVDHNSVPNAGRSGAVKKWMAHLRDPWLRMVAEFLHGDSKAAQQEMERRLAAPDADLREWWIGAWMAWDAHAVFADIASEQAATKLAAERLTKASQLDVEGEARSRLDLALLRAVLALQEPPEDLLKASRGAAGRLAEQSATSSFDAEELRQGFDWLGFNQEGIRLSSHEVKAGINESLARQPPARLAETTDLLVQTDPSSWPLSANDEVAVRQLLRAARASFISRNYRGSPLKEMVKSRGLVSPLLAAITPPPDATSREHFEAGRMFESLHEESLAKTAYEKALDLQLSLHEANLRLALLALPDENEALERMKAMPEKVAAQVVHELSNVSLEVTLGLVSKWLSYLADEKVEPTLDRQWLQQLFFSKPILPAHHELWREAARHPVLNAMAASGMAEAAMRTHSPLMEAADMLRTQLNSNQKRALLFGGQATPSALPHEGVVTQPSPTLIMLWDAWQRSAPAELDDIPTLQDAAGRVGVNLFFCPADQFVVVARDFLRSDSARLKITGHAFTNAFHQGGTLDFISTVWKLRGQPMPLDDLFLEELRLCQDESPSIAAFATYLDLKQSDLLSLESLLHSQRDQWVSSDPARRRVLLHATFERSRYEKGRDKWRRTLRVNPEVRRYLSLLRSMLMLPNTCRVALKSAEEEGLMSKPAWHSSIGQVFSINHNTSSEQFLALMDGFSLLGPANEFRTWGLEADPSSSLFASAVNALCRPNEVSLAALTLLKSRKPSFGRDLALVRYEHRAASDEASRQARMANFVRTHDKGFDAITPQRWPEISPLFGIYWTDSVDAFGQKITWRHPWTVGEQHPELAIIARVQTRHLLFRADEIMKLVHWEEHGQSGYTFCQRAAHSFIALSAKDPEHAFKLAGHTLGLLALPSRIPGPRHVNTPEDPQLEWILQAARSTRTAISVLREALKNSPAIAEASASRREKFSQAIERAEREISEFEQKHRAQ